MYAHEFTPLERKKFPSFMPWLDGALPLMARGRLQDGRRYFVALCPEGAYLIIKHPPHDLGHCLALPFPTQSCARALAKGMGLPGTIDDFRSLGFREP
jgi:hypothetical protein